MAKTYRKPSYHDGDTWGRPGKGKYRKRAYHKAVRRAFKGTGKEKAVARWSSEIGYKGT